MTAMPTLFHVDRLDLSFVPKDWAFARENRAEIDAYFAELQRRKPALWNGRVLLLHHQVVSGGVFRGEYLETDYASFLAWRHWGREDAGVHNCFGAGMVVSADGAVLLGVMNDHTANAGMIYFPAGTPEPHDIADGKVDLALSVARELKEETGCDIGEFSADPGWITAIDGTRFAQIRVLRSRQDAETLRTRMVAHLAQEVKPELSDIRIVRSAADFDPAMPDFVTMIMEWLFRKS